MALHENSDAGEGVAPEETTQLADEYPQIDCPLRILPPEAIKVPQRVDKPSKDLLVRLATFSPQAHNAFRSIVHQYLTMDENGHHCNITDWTIEKLRLSRKQKSGAVASSVKAYSTNQAAHRTAVADSAMLAHSSKRAGNPMMEAQSFLSIGINQDNMGRFQEGVDYYKKFLHAVDKMSDRSLKGLGFNYLGVNYFIMAFPGNEPSPSSTASDLHAGHLRTSISFHERHLQNTDEGGAFVAHTNIGLCYSALEDVAAATEHHQEALRIAIRLQSYSGQAIAVGNLGLLALRNKEYDTAKACLDQHLQLAKTLDDYAAELNAWMLIGSLESARQDYEASASAYENAAQVAERHGEMGLLKRIFCEIGISRSKISATDMIQSLVPPVQEQTE